MSEKEKKIATIGFIALGIISLGAIPLTVWLCNNPCRGRASREEQRSLLPVLDNPPRYYVYSPPEEISEEEYKKIFEDNVNPQTFSVMMDKVKALFPYFIEEADKLHAELHKETTIGFFKISGQVLKVDLPSIANVEKRLSEVMPRYVKLLYRFSLVNKYKKLVAVALAGQELLQTQPIRKGFGFKLVDGPSEFKTLRREAYAAFSKSEPSLQDEAVKAYYNSFFHKLILEASSKTLELHAEVISFLESDTSSIDYETGYIRASYEQLALSFYLVKLQFPILFEGAIHEDLQTQVAWLTSLVVAGKSRIENRPMPSHPSIFVINDLKNEEILHEINKERLYEPIVNFGPEEVVKEFMSDDFSYLNLGEKTFKLSSQFPIKEIKTRFLNHICLNPYEAYVSDPASKDVERIKIPFEIGRKLAFDNIPSTAGQCFVRKLQEMVLIMSPFTLLHLIDKHVKYIPYGLFQMPKLKRFEWTLSDNFKSISGRGHFDIESAQIPLKTSMPLIRFEDALQINEKAFTVRSFVQMAFSPFIDMKDLVPFFKNLSTTYEILPIERLLFKIFLKEFDKWSLWLCELKSKKRFDEEDILEIDFYIQKLSLKRQMLLCNKDSLKKIDDEIALSIVDLFKSLTTFENNVERAKEKFEDFISYLKGYP
jgi:hypothetical protein